MRPEGPVLRRTDYLVDSIPLGMAQELIAAFHYARGSANTAVFLHGLFHRDDPLGCLGAALWMPPTRVAAESVSPDWQRVLTLSRLVIMPAVPTNAASFLLGRSVDLIRRDGRYRTLVTYADEGQGHTGTRDGDPVWVDAAGRQVARKAGPVSRTAAQMTALGYRNTGRTRKHRFVLNLDA